MSGTRRLCVGLLILLTGLSAAVAQEDAIAPENPITRALKNMHRGIVGDPDLTGDASRDQFDSRPPQKPDLARRLSEARSAIRDQSWEESIRLLQFLIDEPDDSLIQLPNGSWKSLHDAAEDVLAAGPEELQRRYRNTNSAVAQSLLEAALPGQNEAQLLELVRRYYLTDAGKSALLNLAKLWRDRAEFVPAGLAFERLSLGTPNDALAEQYRWQAIECFELAQRPDLTARIEPPAARVATWMQRPAPESRIRQQTASDNGRMLPSVIVPDWSSEVSSRYHFRDQAARAYRDLLDADRAPVPQTRALAAGEFVCLKTWRNIELRRRDTGELVWSRSVAVPPEDLFQPAASDPEVEEYSYEGETSLVPYSTEQGDTHQLVSLIYRDSVYGSLAVDRRSLFMIEQERPIETEPQSYDWGWRGSDRSKAKPVSNALVALDQQTGAVRWKVGGPLLEEKFSRPLSGTYFFGAPAVDGDDLFIVGELNSDIYLHCLSARSGMLRWSQMIASTGRPISEDSVRRWWNCTPLIHDGQIICPTTTGWLTAVDRHTRQIRWLRRYVPADSTQRFRNGYANHDVHEMNSRFPSTPPHIAGGKIIVTPPEFPDEFSIMQPLLVCLDITSGEQLWRRPKNELDAVYVAGIRNNQVIVICRHSIRMLSLDDGTTQREIQIPETARPSGLGVFLGDAYLLPTTKPEFLRLDLTSFTLSPIRTPLSVERLGTLTLEKNWLFSLTDAQLLAFPVHHSSATALRLGEEATLDQRLARAEALAADQELKLAVEILEGLTQREDLTQAQQTRIRMLEWRWRLQLLEQDTTLDAEPLDRLALLARTEAEILLVRKLRADQLMKSANVDQAVAAYLDMLRTAADSTIVEGTRRVRCGRWAVGRLVDLSQKFPEQRDGILNSLSTAVQELAALRPESIPELAGDLGHCPQALEIHRLWAERLWDRQDQARLSLVIARIGELSAAPLSAEEQSRRSFIRDSLSLPTDGMERPVLTQSGTLQVMRAGGQGNLTNESTIAATGESLWTQLPLTFSLNSQASRLRADWRPTGKPLWSTPLQSIDDLEQQGQCAVQLLEGCGLIVHSGIVHQTSLLDGKRLWTSEIPESLTVRRSLRSTAPQLPEAFSLPSTFLTYHRLGTRPAPLGHLMDVDACAALLFVDGIVAVDTLTGQHLWTEEDVLASTRAWIVGDEVLIITPGRPPEVRRLLDGRLVPRDGLANLLPRLVGKVGGNLLSIEPINLRDGEAGPDGERSGQSVYQLTSRSLKTLEVGWSASLVPGTSLATRDESTLWTMHRSGQLALIDLGSGQRRELGMIPEDWTKTLSRLRVVSDARRAYVVRDNPSPTAYLALPAVRARSDIMAFDLQQGGILWTLETEKLHPTKSGQPDTAEGDAEHGPESDPPLDLLISGFDALPVLVLVGDLPRERGELTYQLLRVACVDKQTGRVLMDWKQPSNSGSFSQFRYDALRGRIELATYNESLTIQPPIQAPPPPVEQPQ